METMIAYCGLNCETCPIHLATQERDPTVQLELRVGIAEQCFNIYGIVLKVEDTTDCDGCRFESGRLFSGCSNCLIRSCASLRNFISCACCCDYPCRILEDHFSSDPEAKVRLEKIRGSDKK